MWKALNEYEFNGNGKELSFYPFPQDCELKWAEWLYMDSVKTQKTPPLTNQSNHAFDEVKNINKPCLLCSGLFLWGPTALSQTTVTWTSEPLHLQNYCPGLAAAFEAGDSFIWLNTHMGSNFSTLLQRCGNFGEEGWSHSSLGTSSDLLFYPSKNCFSSRIFNLDSPRTSWIPTLIKTRLKNMSLMFYFDLERF